MSGPPPLKPKQDGPAPEAPKQKSKIGKLVSGIFSASVGDYFIAMGEGLNAAHNCLKKKKGE